MLMKTPQKKTKNDEASYVLEIPLHPGDIFCASSRFHRDTSRFYQGSVSRNWKFPCGTPLDLLHRVSIRPKGRFDLRQCQIFLCKRADKKMELLVPEGTFRC